MGKKGKKTRWRRLPIGGAEEEGGLSLESQPPVTDPHRITFNEDEYTKITTPRQDVLFKKGYFGRKRTPNPCPSETQEVHSGDSVESESYVSEEPQYAYPTGYMDPSGGLYYVNGNTFETYDPYTGTVTVVVGPAAQYPGGAPVLAALPCQPVPLQPLEWFNPPAPAPWCYSYNRRKRYSTDSQNCSAQSSESTGPPGSPQEPVDEGACAMYPPQYVYPGYMFGPPIYNMNGVTVQGMIPQPVPMQPADLSASKRRKKRRRRRRGGVTDDGSESSCCEEPLTCDVPGCQSETSSDAVCQSGASSDAGAGPNSDSGINTDPTPNSGSNSPPLDLAQVTKSVSDIQFQCHQQPEQVQLSANSDEYQSVVSEVSQESHILPLCSNTESVNECVPRDDGRSQDDVITPEEVSEELSTTEEDVTPNLCDAVPEFSSQESTLSCLSTPSVNKDLSLNEQEISIVDVSQEEVFESCQSFTEVTSGAPAEEVCGSVSYNNFNCHTVVSAAGLDPTNCNNDLRILVGDENESQESITKLSTEKTKSTTNNEKEEHSGTSENLNKKYEDSTEVHNLASLPETVQCIDVLPVGETSVLFDEGKATEVCWNAKEIHDNFAEPVCVTPGTNFQSSKVCEISHSDLRLLPSKDTLAPVPPPRRKRSMSRAADKLATRIVEEAIKEGIEEAVCTRLRSPISITEAVTRWLNSQGSSPLTCPPSDTESDDDDEGIEDGEGSTDQKNVRGNPFPVSSRSGSGQRVAKDCESMVSSAGEWDLWDHSHTREMCDPARSVDKYYRLGVDENVGDKVPPSVYKTAMHIRHTGPFPCGVCCIIQ